MLRGIDLDVHRGEVLVLIGPSGSGKTTVLRTLNGLETPDGGTFRMDDLDLDFPYPVGDVHRFALRDHSAMVFQSHNLFPHKTVLQNVIEGPVVVQKVPKAAADRGGGGPAGPRRAAGQAGQLPVPAVRRPAATGRASSGRWR